MTLAAAVPSAADPPRIVLLETMPVPVVLEFRGHFIAALTEPGPESIDLYNITLLEAEGDRDFADRLLAEALKASKPDLVVTIATLASQAARELLKGTGIPQLFAVVADPVGAGLAQRIGVPAGQAITGFAASLPRDIQMSIALDLARQVVKNRPVNIGVVTSDYPSSLSDLRLLQEASAATAGILIREHIVPYRDMAEGKVKLLEDFRAGIDLLKSQIDFWWEVSGPTGERGEFIEALVEEGSRPVLYGNTLEAVAAGALFGMIRDIEQSAAETAAVVRDILRGTDAGTIPVMIPSRFSFGLNLRTAVAAGIVIPPELLGLAGDNLYW